MTPAGEQHPCQNDVPISSRKTHLEQVARSELIVELVSRGASTKGNNKCKLWNIFSYYEIEITRNKAKGLI